MEGDKRYFDKEKELEKINKIIDEISRGFFTEKYTVGEILCIKKFLESL